MANYQISATLNAQINGFRQNMTESERAANHAATSIDRSMGRIDVSATRTGRAVAASAQQIRSSGNQYLEFGRVLQDLPFGFQGIQNNLTQIIPAAGAAGLAFSAIVSAITFAQIGTVNWTRGLKDNKNALDASKKSGDEYLATLNALGKAALKGTQDAQEELIKLKTLYNISTDVSVSMKQRKDAVDALQKQYPDYFKNLKDEAILTGNASAEYRELTRVILATARAEAARGLLIENSQKVIEDETKMRNLQADRAKIVEQETKSLAERTEFVQSQYTSQQKSFKISGEQFKNQLDQIQNLDSIKKIDEQIVSIAKGRNQLTKDNLNLTKMVNSEVKKGADLADYTASKTDSGTMFKKSDIGDARMPKDLMDPTYAYRQKNALADLLKPLNDYESGVAQFQNNLSDSQERAIAQMLDFNSTFQQTVEQLGSSTVVEGISNGFTAIGEALYSGADVFQAAGQAILQTVSGFLGELGNMLIQKGIATVAAGVALNFLAPGAGAKQVAGGLGLIAAGAALSVASGIGSAAASGGSKKKPSNVTAFANGGVVYGPTNALIGDYSGARNNPEVVAPLNKLKGMLGNNAPNIYAEFSVSSKQLALVVRDGNNKLNRS